MLKIPKIGVAYAERERESTIQQGVAVGMDDWNIKWKCYSILGFWQTVVYARFFVFVFVFTVNERGIRGIKPWKC